MSNTFLRAGWRKLVMANYAIDPAVLKDHVPYKTELDLWNNTCYVSLVGFMFVDYKIDVDFGKVYGEAFGFLSQQKPTSVFLAEGSAIAVNHGKRIT